MCARMEEALRASTVLEYNIVGEAVAIAQA